MPSWLFARQTPLILLVAGFVLVLTGIVALQTVGVLCLLVAFAIPIAGTSPRWHKKNGRE